MTHFTPLTGEDREIRDSIVQLRLKKDLEFFVLPRIYLDMLVELRRDSQKFLHSEKKIENAIAVEYNYHLSQLINTLNLLKND